MLEMAELLYANGFLTQEELEQVNTLSYRAARRGAFEKADAIELAVRQEYIKEAEANPLKISVDNLGLPSLSRNTLIKMNIFTIAQLVFFEKMLGDIRTMSKSLGKIQLPLVQNALQSYLQQESYTGEVSLKQQAAESIRAYRTIANPVDNTLARYYGLGYRGIITIGDFLKQSGGISLEADHYTPHGQSPYVPNPKRDFDSILRGVNSIIAQTTAVRKTLS